MTRNINQKMPCKVAETFQSSIRRSGETPINDVSKTTFHHHFSCPERVSVAVNFSRHIRSSCRSISIAIKNLLYLPARPALARVTR